MSTISVLIVEPDSVLGAALEELLAGQDGIDIAGTAASVEEAERLAAGGAPDVAVVDTRGGASAIARVIAASPQTRVVALSGSESRRSVIEALRAGARGYVLKGAPGARVIEAVRFVARGEAVLSREVTAGVIDELVGQLARSEELSRELKSLDQAKSEIVQILSHELLTPVAVIQAYTQTVSRGVEIPEGLLAELQRGFVEAAGKMRRLVGNVTAAAQLVGPGAETELRPVALGEIVRRAVAEFVPHAGRIDVAQGDGPQGWVHVDLAVQAVMLVLENALAFSPADRAVRLETESSGAAAVVRVLDRGPGIPPELRDRVREPFTQVDQSETRSQGGIGIGLHLATRIMEAHGGALRIAARPRGGSIVTLEFAGLPSR